MNNFCELYVNCEPKNDIKYREQGLLEIKLN